MNNEKALIPEINKEYNHFDDGKINRSRQCNVRINEVIPFDKIDEETLTEWESEVTHCDWLYKKQTDMFIKATLYPETEDAEEIVYVRTKQDDWFSMGGMFSAGTLDVDGSLLKYIEDLEEEYKKEQETE